MAKKVVASLQKGGGKEHTKVIKMVKMIKMIKTVRMTKMMKGPLGKTTQI